MGSAFLEIEDQEGQRVSLLPTGRSLRESITEGSSWTTSRTALPSTVQDARMMVIVVRQTTTTASISRLAFTTQHLQGVGRRQPGDKTEDIVLQLRVREPSDGCIDHEVDGMRYLDVVRRDERIRSGLPAIKPDSPTVPTPVFLMSDNKLIFADVLPVKGFHGLSGNCRKRLRHRINGDCLGVREQSSWLLKLVVGTSEGSTPCRILPVPGYP